MPQQTGQRPGRGSLSAFGGAGATAGLCLGACIGLKLLLLGGGAAILSGLSGNLTITVAVALAALLTAAAVIRNRRNVQPPQS